MKKQITALYFNPYQKVVTAILLLLSLFISTVQADPSSLSSSEQLLQTPYLYQSVNVITGDYCEANTDLINRVNPKFKIRRCFSNGEGWTYNLPLIKQPQTPNKENPPFQYSYDKNNRLITINQNNDKTPILEINYPSNETMNMVINGQPLSYEFEPTNSRLGVPPFLITRFCQQDVELCRYHYRQHPFLRKQLLEKKEENGGSYCLNEYYDKKSNDVGDIKVVIEDPVRDYRIGRVKLQKGPVGSNEDPIITARYFYYTDYTEVLDALGRKTIYRYQHDRLIAIENYTEGQLYRCERLFWHKSHEKGEWDLTAKAWEDGQGNVVKCITYEYDKQGNLLLETLYGSLSGKNTPAPIIDCEGRIQDNGAESYTKRRIYSSQPPFHLVSESEDNGKTIRYCYDPITSLKTGEFTGLLTAIQQRRFFEYDEKNRLISTIVDDGISQDVNDLQGVTERHLTTFHYNPNEAYSEQPTITEEKYFDPTSGSYQTERRIICAYDKQGQLQLKQVFHSDGILATATTFTYDLLGKLIKELDETGTGYEKNYDTQGRLLSEVLIEDNNILQKTTFTYDLANRLIAKDRIDRDGKHDTSSYQYNYAGEKTAEIDSFGNTTIFSYDDVGRLIKTTPPLVLDGQNHLQAPTVRYRYDTLNNLIGTTNPNGYHVDIRYNSYGKPIEKIYPDGTKELFYYNLDGTLKEAIDKKGVSTVYDRDIFGRETFVEVLDAISHIRLSLASTYSAFHLIQTMKDGKLTTTYSYRPDGKLATKEQHFLEGVQRIDFSYDKAGRIDSQIESWGKNSNEKLITTYTYDQKDILLKTTLTDVSGTILAETFTSETPSSPSTTQEGTITNEHGQLVKQTYSQNMLGQTTIITYDVLGQIEDILVKHSNGQTIKHLGFRYDLSGNKTKEILYNNETSAIVKVNLWNYDNCNRLTSSVEAADTPYARITRYHYNALGQLEQIAKPSGITINHQYSALGQLKDYYASDFSFKYHFIYDDQGHLVKIEDLIHNTTTNRKFNTFGQIIYEELGNGLKIKNAYDPIGRKTHLTLPDSSSITYHYDPLYLRSIERYSNNNQLVYSHTYEEYSLKGLVTKASLIGSTGQLSLSYTDQGICNGITSSHWEQQMSYEGLDTFGHIKALEGTDSHGPWQSAFSYNDSQELTDESGAFVHHYSYDGSHNRTSADNTLYKNNLLNQLYAEENAKETVEYLYDQNGNLVEKTTADHKTLYHYDALDRLIEVEIEESLSIHFIYDAFYRRLSKTLSKWDPVTSQWSPAKTYRYIYDHDREIGTVDSQGNIKELRVLGTSLVNGNLQSEISAAIAHEINGKAYAPIHDHRGNVCCLVEATSGEIAESYRYSAFGEMETYSGDGTPLKKSALKLSWLFSSKRWDSETGLIFYGKRYYDPTIGRWTTKDPLGSFDGQNAYSFLHNDPLSHIDLYGLFSFSTAWQGAKDLAGAAAGALVNFKKNVSYTSYMQKEWDQIAEEFIGRGFLQFSGYYSHPIESGCTPYGEEVDDKVRITLINGILNVRRDLDQALKLFSSTHGNTPIHYVYRPTEGWTKDLLTSTLSKFGYTSPYAKLLAETWREMIEEMGGVGQGGKIIHYAHSIGATDTYVAKNLLTPEEQQMIHVISMGSPTMIPKGSGFGSVINYVSRRDGVCLLDPIGYVSGYFNGTSHIELVGSLWGIPLIDHTLYTDSYGGVIKELGEQFIGIYK